MTDFIPVNRPSLDGNEMAYVKECIDTAWISSEGTFIRRFETEFAKYVGRKYSVAVANGTAALDLAIESLKLNPGDEIIVPTFTIISCINQIMRSGLIPVFIDCDARSFNMNVHEIEEKITSKTRAILIAHIYGLTVELDVVDTLCKKYNLFLIEDAAEAHGNSYNGAMCGSFGDISTFSFYPNKHITTGEGGMVLTDDVEIYNRLLGLRNLCFTEERFIHTDIGWNYRMTNMQAALGVAQLETIDKKINHKKELGAFYTEALSDISEIILPIESLPYCENHYWVYPILIAEGNSLTAKDIMELLKKAGIGTRPMFYPLHLQPVLKKYNIESDLMHSNAEKIYSRGFYIPSGLGTTKLEQQVVIKALRNIWEYVS